MVAGSKRHIPTHTVFKVLPPIDNMAGWFMAADFTVVTLCSILTRSVCSKSKLQLLGPACKINNWLASVLPYEIFNQVFIIMTDSLT